MRREIHRNGALEPGSNFRDQRREQTFESKSRKSFPAVTESLPQVTELMRDWIVQRKSSKSKSKSKSNEVPATAMRGRDRDEPRVPWFPVFDRQWGKIGCYQITILPIG